MRATGLLALALIGWTGCAVDDTEVEEVEEVERWTTTVDFGSGPVEISYEVVDGMAVFEGDIILGTVEDVSRGDLVFGDASAAIQDGVLTAGLSHLNSWPGGKVPYVIDAAAFPVGSARRGVVEDAIEAWNSLTTVRLVPHGSSIFEHYVTFSPGDSDYAGSAAIGFQPGTSQRIYLGAKVGVGLVIHEIGHTVGLFHEQSRNDRNDYVLINYSNIAAGQAANFNTYSILVLDYGTYDLGSVMHYGSFTFAKNPQLPTIVKKIAGCTVTSTAAQCRITPPSTLSDRDKKGVTRLVSGDPLIKDRIRNEASDLCLRPVGGSTTSGAAVVLADCSNTLSRRWYEFKRPDTSAPMIINENSRLCLATDSNNRLIQTHCTGASTQRFVTADVAGWFNGDAIKRGTLCLSGGAAGTAPVLQSSCGSAAQRWFRDHF